MFSSISVSRTNVAGFLTRIVMASRMPVKRCTPTIAGLLLLLPHIDAMADLMINPKRIVMERNQRSAQVDLINQGKETATYRISLVNRRMSENGELSEVETPLPDERFADALVRYSPRQVVLPPGSSQVVRILLRKPAGLTPGEYRSHLLFEKVPQPRNLTSIETARDSEKKLTITLVPQIGISIPLIVRHGETKANVLLSNLELQQLGGPDSLVAALRMERSGNRSLYGDLVVSFTPDGGAEQEIARAGGVAIYVPNTVRHAKIALKSPSGFSLRDGTLRVTFRERTQDGGKLLAETAIRLH